MTTTIRISTPTEILETIPVLLGFYPTDSIVGLFLDRAPSGGMSIQFTTRMDVPVDEVTTRSALANISQATDRSAAVVLVIYTPDQDEARTLMSTILTHTDSSKMIGLIMATLTGWTTIDPEHLDTIQPTEPYPTGTGIVAAELAMAGLYAIGTRADLADSINAPDAATAEDYALGRSLDVVPTHPTADQLVELTAEVRHWVRYYLDKPTTIIPEEAAYLAARIQHNQPRDSVVEILNRNSAPKLAAMWQAVAALTPDRDAKPVLASLALAAWVAGNGALANVAIKRANPLNGPGSALISIVETLIEGMIPPAMWEDFKATL